MTLTIATAGKQIGGRLALLLSGTLGTRAGDSFGILLYHRVTPVPDGVAAPTMNVTPSRFREQIEGLLESGYVFWPLRDVIEHVREGQPIPVNVVVLTFDDGYRNFYSNVWPLLLQWRVPATLFVATGYIDAVAPFPFDQWGRAHHRRVGPEAWQPLTWSQCRNMERSAVVDIGSHSHTHRNFRGKPDELRQDLRTSLALLEKEIGYRPRAFAFPYGSARREFVDASLIASAKACGVTCSLTTEIRLANPATDPFTWPRLEVVDTDSSAVVRAKLEGWYNWMEAARHAYRRLRSAYRDTRRSRQERPVVRRAHRIR
jgi:peptidoglycan/xylan/chitin deacetylase (PgdA/CDA1 family)